MINSFFNLVIWRRAHGGAVVDIDARHVDRRRSTACATGFLRTVNACRSRLSFFGQSVPPRVGLGAKIPLDARVFEGLAGHLVLHHVFEIMLDGTQNGAVVNVELGSVALGYGAGEVVEEGLSFVDGLDAAFVKVRGHHAGSWGRFTGGQWRFDWFDALQRRWGRRY